LKRSPRRLDKWEREALTNETDAPIQVLRCWHSGSCLIRVRILLVAAVQCRRYEKYVSPLSTLGSTYEVPTTGDVFDPVYDILIAHAGAHQVAVQDEVPRYIFTASLHVENIEAAAL